MSYRKSKKQLAERALKGQGNTGGFSMAETLATVAIIVILLALAVVGIFNLYYSLQQKELDSKAEIIYVAAQDQMTKIMAAGRSTLMQPDDYSTKIKDIPADAKLAGSDATQDDPDANYVEQGSIAFLTSAELQNDAQQFNAAKTLFGDGGLDEDLLNGNWIVEYDYTSLIVYAVFYFPDDSELVDEYSSAINDENSSSKVTAAYRSYSLRLEALKGQGDDHVVHRVGYYGGAGSTSGSESKNIDTRIDIDNGEKLVATITANRPLALNKNLVFRVDVSDDYGNTYRTFYTYGEQLKDNYSAEDKKNNLVTDWAIGSASDSNIKPGTLCRSGYQYSLKLVLDSLNKGARFTTQYGSGLPNNKVNIAGVESTTKRLVEGSNIKVTVSVTCNGDASAVSTPQSDTANSLFADNSCSAEKNTADTALIKFGRHLQNLDKSSGINNNLSILEVNKARQEKNEKIERSEGILFALDNTSTLVANYDWYKTYGKTENSGSYFNGYDGDVPRFKPVVNPELKEYDGNGLEIKNLWVRAEGTATDGGGDAGLFGSVEGNQSLSIKNLVLSSPNIKCVKNTGDHRPAGGFVGLIQGQGASVAISNCVVRLATEDRKANTQANSWVQGWQVGGLVGLVRDGGSVVVENSSASTVMGYTEPGTIGTYTTVGGLIGKAENGTTVVLSSSYADSYLMGSVVGGLIGEATNLGSGSSITNCYSAGFVGYRDAMGGIVARGNIGGGISRCYTLLDKLGKQESGGYASEGDACPIAPNGNTLSNCHYMSFDWNTATASDANASPFDDSESAASELLDALNAGAGDSAAYVQNRSDVSVYNLMNQGLEPSYAWPMIKGLWHYGDWSAGFKPGSLVYYEKYEDSSQTGDARYSYGFTGANVSPTLKATSRAGKKRFAVVGDGYGVVYDSAAADMPTSIKVRVADPASSGSRYDSGEVDINLNDAYNVGGYKIYPLPSAVVNTEFVNEQSYYLKATITKTFAGSGGATSTVETANFFNPHFAESVIGASDKVPSIESKAVSVRTARQLNNLSRYYKKYRDTTKDYVFDQGRNIDYTEYEWGTFGKDGVKVSKQEPIGLSADKNESFIAHYDGNSYEITDVSFEARTYEYVGLFGAVGKGGKIDNVVLCTDYAPTKQNADGTSNDNKKNFYLSYKGDLKGNKTAHLGVLAGDNEGEINNCAVAGYYIAGSDGTIRSYTNSRVDVGGLVGTNKGKISNCSADNPRLRLAALYSTVNAGGFVGRNISGGTVASSYALGAVELAEAKGGAANISGFAGSNEGRIESSYTATALSVSGENAMSYGFAPKGGYTSSDCRYLNGGTYSFIKKMYSYNFSTSVSSGKPITFDALKKTSTKGQVAAGNSFYHENTSTGEDDAYPYMGVVRNVHDSVDSNGKRPLVHYGDWQDDVQLGTLGIFYWEKEEGGSNDGYHMTYLGAQADWDDAGNLVESLAEGTSLCTAHDDGGVITEYGYGIYAQSGQDVSAKWRDIACSSDRDSGGNSWFSVTDVIDCNVSASQAIKEQMENLDSSANRNYVFRAFTTRAKKEAGDGDYIALDSEKGQNGSLTLRYKDGGHREDYVFAISPFFANAMSVSKDDLKKNNEDQTLEASDGTRTDYFATPGLSESSASGAGNAYEIRSVDQLQYLNWNWKTGSTDALVNDKNYQQFNYLLYADGNKLDQNKPDGDISKIASDSSYRANLHWVQTHDSVSTNDEALYTPIAGTTMSSPQRGGYQAVLYAWFGGHYNGQSYTVKNVSITTKSFNVGLFGTTVGADLHDVIMYSDNGSVIKRETTGTSEDKDGAYSIGGLVGVAMDYVVDASKLKDKEDGYIFNCAISGYSIEDWSKNREGLGEANVGGLIGVSNVNLRQCSANVDIREHASLKKGVAHYGAYIRVGGLTGGALGYVKDCYSGGSFDFDQTMTATGNVNFDDVEKPDNNPDANKRVLICAGGIAGSAFSSNYINLTGEPNVRDGSPTIENCYTYFRFPTTKPAANSEAKEVSLIMSTVASRADRANRNSGTMTITNCYYYSSIVIKGVEEQYKGSQGIKGSNPKPVTYQELCGDELVEVGNGTSGTREEAFLDLLNAGREGNDAVWAPVSTVDYAGKNIDGKFSFPANAALQGKNYPFPTVVTQNDLSFGTVSNPVPVHVHYGDWPFENASYWENGRGTIDIFDNRDPVRGDSYAYGEFKLHINKEDQDGISFNGAVPSLDSFSFEDDDIAEIVSCTPIPGEEGVFTVRIKALGEGATVVRLGNTSARFSLQVTANLDLTAEIGDGSSTSTVWAPDENRLTIEYKQTGDKAQGVLNLIAASVGSNQYDYSKYVVWGSLKSEEETRIDSEILEGSNVLTVTREDSGEVLLPIEASYDYNGHSISKQIYINVVEPGLLGLSNGSSFNEARNTNAPEPAKDNDYKNNEASKPSYSFSGSENLYLYASNDEDYFDNPDNIENVEINGVGGYSDGSYDSTKDFFVSFAENATASGSFKYLPATVSYNKETVSWPSDGKVAIKVRLKNGVLLSTTVDKADIGRVPFKMLGFEYQDNNGKTQTEKIEQPVGSKVLLKNYSLLNASSESKARFEDWRVGDTNTYLKNGAKYVVDESITFVPSFRNALILKVKTGAKSEAEVGRLYVSNHGQDSFGNDYSALINANDTINKYCLEGWYDGTNLETATRVLNEDGSFASGDLAFGGASTVSLKPGNVSGRTMKLSDDVLLYAARAIWSHATSVTAGNEYVIASAKTTVGSNGLSQVELAGMTALQDGTYTRYDNSASFKTTETVNFDGSIFKLGAGTAQLSRNGKIEDKVDARMVWRAEESDANIYKDYFTLCNDMSGMYLTDAGGADTWNGTSGSYWFLAGIEDIANNPTLKIGTDSSYRVEARSYFAMRDSDGCLATFNSPNGHNYVTFVGSGVATHSGILYAGDINGYGHTYLYEKSLSADWS